jgi:hypothetical protein
MAKAKGGNGQGVSKTASERQKTIDAVQAARRAERKARKNSKKFHFVDEETNVIVKVETVKNVSNVLTNLYIKARDCLRDFGNTRNTRKYIENSYQYEDACLAEGLELANKKIEEALETVRKEGFSEKCKEILTEKLLVKAKGCFSNYGPSHRTSQYIRNSWEFENITNTFGEVMAEAIVQEAFTAVVK